MGEPGEMETISEEEFWAELRKQILQDDAQGAKQQALRLAAELKGWTKGSAKDKSPATTDLPKPLQEVAKKLQRKPIKRDEPDEFGLVSGTARMAGEQKEKDGTTSTEPQEVVASPPGAVSTEQTDGQAQDR